jgi:hypothetical protein
MIFILAAVNPLGAMRVKNDFEIAAASEPDKIVYRYIDASISPEYAQNYTITVTKSSAKIAVQTDKGIKQSTVKISKAQFRKIRRIIRESAISEGEDVPNDGCTGGTGEEISLFEGAKQTLKASVYHCGGDDHGTLKGNTEAVKTKLKSLFPKLSKTLK